MFNSPFKSDLPPAKVKSGLLVGIDFGTTYTGVSYAYVSEHARDSLTPEQLREKVVVLKNWPGVAGTYTEKVPSILAYDSNGQVIAWGGKVKSSHSIRVSHFKLGLQDGADEHYAFATKSEGQRTRLEQLLATPSWKHPLLPGKEPIDHVQNFLKEIHQYVITEALPQDFGRQFLARIPIQYVLTVPAIWSDKARDSTRKAAVKVGIPDRDLTVITEPEAAALYCSTLCHEVDLTDGDHFLVCDAGGGTVDLITYEIISRRPFVVRECTQGTGGACGAIFLTEYFKELLVKKIGPDHMDILTPKRVAEAVKTFEQDIKFTFNPYSDDEEDSFEIPLPGAPDIPQLKLIECCLPISGKSILQHVFMPLFNKITNLVHDQVKKVKQLHGKDVKTIFLVGGFGSNMLLASLLKSRLREGLTLMQPSGGHSAIMRGAVFSALGMRVPEQILRRHYGLSLARPFEIGKDPTELKYINLAGDEVCGNTFYWYANMDQRVSYGYAYEQRVRIFCRQMTWDGAETYFHSTELWISEKLQPPKYNWNVSGGRTLVSVTADLKTLPTSAVSAHVNSLGVPYYEISFSLRIRFLATLEYTLLYENQVYGSVVAEYE